MIFSPARGRQGSTIRIILMLFLFVGVGYLFWKNYERSMDTIQTRHIVNDETGTLEDELVRDIVSYSKSFQRRFGMGVQVRIFQNFVVSPPQDSRMIFIGISPRYKESSVVFPPILQRALPEDFVSMIRYDHFERYWDDDWQKGLAEALNLIGQEMVKIEKGE